MKFVNLLLDIVNAFALMFALLLSGWYIIYMLFDNESLSYWKNVSDVPNKLILSNVRVVGFLISNCFIYYFTTLLGRKLKKHIAKTKKITSD